MTKQLKNIIIVALAAITTLSAINTSYAGSPTQQRTSERRTANNQQYFQCAAFSMRVLQGCEGQAGSNVNQSRGCKRHYQSNLGRCRAKYL